MLSARVLRRSSPSEIILSAHLFQVLDGVPVRSVNFSVPNRSLSDPFPGYAVVLGVVREQEGIIVNVPVGVVSFFDIHDSRRSMDGGSVDLNSTENIWVHHG